MRLRRFKTGGGNRYCDAAKSAFKSPTRLECMMQDYPKLLPASARVGFTRVAPWLCYSPVKNAPATVRRRRVH